MKWRVLILFIIVIGFGYWGLNQKEKTSDSSENSTPSKLITQIQQVFQSKPQASKVQEQVVTPEAQTIADFIKSEAQKMEIQTFDQVLEEARLREIAVGLSIEEIQILKNKAMSLDVSANERIFSTFMLSLSSSQSLKALQEIATSELSVKGTPQPHSLDETQSMHEKALLRMAIDELFKRAIADPTYQEELASEIDKIKVPELKVYAQNRFKELFG